MTTVPLTNPDDPELEPYWSLRRPQEHWRRRIFIAEGRLVVERLLRSNCLVRSVLTTPSWLARVGYLLESRPEQVKVFVAEKKTIQTIVGFSYHAGLLALAECPPEPPLEEVLKRSPSPRTWVALDELSHAENVGVIVRNAAALGAQAVLVGETSCSPYLRRAVRNSLGGVFCVPILHVAYLAETLQQLHDRHNFHIVGADANKLRPLQEYRFPRDVCLVFGHEDLGLSEDVQRYCQDFVTIPMGPQLDSINVACASAIFLHEIRRQRVKPQDAN
jgi:tRNA G18 (ribose-2'-O)-methylase SpoU